MAVLPLSGPLLVLDAATATGSVALLRDGQLLGVRIVVMGQGQDDHLFPAVQALLQEAALTPAALVAVVCGAGPGSFTSLRIAAALAKGLCHGAGCPLYAVPSLLLAAAALPAEAVGPFLVHADALRGERYVLPVERQANGSVSAAGPLARVATAALAESTQQERRVAVTAAPDALPSAYIVTPDASRVLHVSGGWREQEADLASWEPTYGRLAEAQVKWEATHGVSLPTGSAS
jgi:tRNA threonylcarbamoyladenosine biosynthesis protein TsaB